MLRLRGLLPLAAVVAVIAACSGKDPYEPGEAVGTFRVTGQLTQTTCGQPPNPWEFDVKVNRDGSTLYWIQGAQPIAGEVDASGRTTMKASFVHEVRPADERKKLAACSIARTDVLAMALARADERPAADPADVRSFSGIISYTFAPTEGSSCDDQLTATGGGYDALPCVVSYQLTAKMTKPAESN
ncbi:MAG: hypothetical protein KIT84_24160 [Labilithrix sp.]|nr:hypothetical protein [Labilithrix sp.]MCW5814144.1 hypothetical protein [Labilithrix sp.]